MNSSPQVSRRTFPIAMNPAAFARFWPFLIARALTTPCHRSAAGEGVRQQNRGDVSVGGRLYARRHLGTLRWHRQPHQGVELPPWRNCNPVRLRDVGGLQDGRSSPCVTEPPWDVQGQAAADLFFGCVCEVSGVKHLAECTISSLCFLS
jgi:hypothetical protein